MTKGDTNPKHREEKGGSTPLEAAAHLVLKSENSYPHTKHISEVPQGHDERVTSATVNNRTDENCMSPVQRLRDAPRCGAKAKSTGTRCNAPAVRGWRVCRVHGAKGGHKAGRTHPQWKHGGRSRETTTMRNASNLLAKLGYL